MKHLTHILVALALIPLAGCGGGRSAETTGRLTITVQWPESTRLVPEASRAVRVQAFDGATIVDTGTVVRAGSETGTVTLDNLPIANIQLVATAYPADPGLGTTALIAQASGSRIIPIQPGLNTGITVTMASTIDRISVTSTSLSVNSATQPLTATALDINGNLVLTTPARMEWSTSDAGIVTVTSAGVVTAVAPGVAIITVRDTESLKSGTGSVTVSNTGQTANVTVNNPPTGTRSLRIEITNGAQMLSSRITAWATGNTIIESFTGLPAGTHTVTATAVSQDSGGGSDLGSATGPITVPPLGSASITLNLTSRVASLALTPANSVVIQGQNVTLSVVALDAAAVPIATLISSGFNWETVPTPSGIASVNGSGVVSTIVPGTVGVRATDSRTGQFGQTNITATNSSASAGGVVR